MNGFELGLRKGARRMQVALRNAIEDDTLQIDPQEHVIEHYGHARYYAEHYCPKCEETRECKASLCRLPSTIECLTCAQRELLTDTERFSKEAVRFLNTEIPQATDALGVKLWHSMRSQTNGKLQGLATRSAEIAKRIDSGEKS
jgi:hypothetical protein